MSQVYPAPLPTALQKALIDSGQYITPAEQELLAYLCANHGRVITPHELTDICFISYDAAWVYVCRLRKALGDDAANPRYIRTHRASGIKRTRGYEWIGPVDDQEVAA
jgi:DNA-binding response OmpR family regulator